MLSSDYSCTNTTAVKMPQHARSVPQEGLRGCSRFLQESLQFGRSHALFMSKYSHNSFDGMWKEHDHSWWSFI